MGSLNLRLQSTSTILETPHEHRWRGSTQISGKAAGLTDLSLAVYSPPDRPPAPVNVSVMHLRADSATISWEVPEGDIIIGFSISQQVILKTSNAKKGKKIKFKVSFLLSFLLF